MLEIPQLDIAGTPKEISGLVYQLQSSKKAQKEFAHYLHHSPVVDTFVAQTLEALALGNIWSAQIAGDFFAGIDASATQKDLLSKMSNAGAAARILFWSSQKMGEAEYLQRYHRWVFGNANKKIGVILHTEAASGIAMEQVDNRHQAVQAKDAVLKVIADYYQSKDRGRQYRLQLELSDLQHRGKIVYFQTGLPDADGFLSGIEVYLEDPWVTIIRIRGKSRAEEFSDRITEAYRTIPSNAKIAASLFNDIAHDLAQEGDFLGAAQMFRQEYEIRRDDLLFPEEDYAVFSSLVASTQMYVQSGKHEEAALTMQEAYDHWQEASHNFPLEKEIYSAIRTDIVRMARWLYEDYTPASAIDLLRYMGEDFPNENSSNFPHPLSR